MSKQKLKVALSGANGNAQILHLPILSRMPNVEVVAICDTNYERAQRIASKFNIRGVHCDYLKMIDIYDLDIVDICTAVQFHYHQAIAALEKGCHVLIEKPFAESAQQASELVRLAEERDKKIMAMMNLKFRPDAIALKSIIQNQAIGHVFCVKSGWLRRSEKWLQQQSFLKSEQGVIMHLGTQVIDLSLWLMGNPKVNRIKAVSFNRIMQSWVEDSAFLFLHLDNDALITVEISWNFDSKNDSLYVDLLGDQGMARLNPFTLFTRREGRLVDVTPSKGTFKSDPYLKSYENEISHFVFCLLNNQQMQSSGREIIERIKIIDAIYQSIKTGKEVKFDET